MAFSFHLPSWVLPARGHAEVNSGRKPWSRIIHLPRLLPSPIFWSVTLWKESVSGAAGTGRQGRIVRDEGGGRNKGWILSRVENCLSKNLSEMQMKYSSVHHEVTVNGWLCSILTGWEIRNTVPLLIPLHFPLSRQELLCLLESFSASIWDTLIANLDFHLERKEETDQTLSPVSTFGKSCFLIKWTISESPGLDSSESPRIPAGAGWSEVMPSLVFTEQRIIFLYPKGSEEPNVWVTGAHRAAANSPRPTVAPQVNREQKGFFRSIENMDDHP